MINIETIEEYNYAKKRGYEPLRCEFITLSFHLRLELQSILFSGTTIQANNKFYHWAWDNSPHYCEECKSQLYNYDSKFISHILSRGAFAEMAHDTRNFNILCLHHHQIWENPTKRKMMSIYEKNQSIIQQLKLDYNGRI